MNEKHLRFGELIRKKRLADPREITQGEMAKQLGISLAYVSEIEHCRRKPFDAESIEKFCAYLNLPEDTKTLLFDLAAKERHIIPADIEEVLMYDEIGNMARFALRESNAGNVTTEDWKKFIQEIEKKKKRGTT